MGREAFPLNSQQKDLSFMIKTCIVLHEYDRKHGSFALQADIQIIRIQMKEDKI